ncbi:HisA/HisF-related TIM barrel protein [Actinomadura macrotermitis]|uniref:Imidazole glycerol phosphate synthase subunit HisF n=1 Tax=Actinomadura macrotermitis TaxID=2585200 RepID=A0A7K0C4V6_9ACTN|nr:HisA/HisF-related TIM barrel protein [Actinomadura macrotermitis]MQY08152.1 Imidazole glycerol phosphate synthase subunit HisF [Actinomadura macrotermitis]
MCCVVVDDQGRMTEPAGVPALRGDTDPVRMARHYRSAGAEVMFVDIWDDWSRSERILPLVRRLAGTGLSLVVSVDNGALPSVGHARSVLAAGAFAVTVNTVAHDAPDLVRSAAGALGGEHLVGVVNVVTDPAGAWDVRVDGGRRSTGVHPAARAGELSALGVGSLIINDMDHEQRGGGFNLPLLKAVLETATVPVICGGGSRSPEDLPPAIAAGAHSVLVLTQLHDGSHTVQELLDVLR